MRLPPKPKTKIPKETAFFRGKMADGSWNPKFDPIKSVKPWATDYAEGNPWQYLWLVPQDVKGLIDLLGGSEIFEDRLNTFFSLSSGNDPDVLVDLTGCIGQYAHGNEPSHHIAYLYASIGKQWKTARLVRQITRDFYSDRPDGVIGNEDCGQMSAWYLFSSLGFYPVFTASGEYVLGSPLFDKATIHLENGKKFVIETSNNSLQNAYIQTVELNGKNYNSSIISHEDIMQGGVIKIKMGNAPNYDFGKKSEKPFVRPGMAQNQEDLDFMRNNVLKGREPWKTAFANLKKQTDLDFQPKPVAFISEGPYGANSVGGREFSQSARAAYNHAVMWYITQDKAYAEKAVEILNAWSYKLKSFDANNAKLNVGLFGYHFLNAAEILKYSYSAWTEKDQEQFLKMVMLVFYPTIEDFFTEANGNWDASMISTMLCIGIYTDNREIFNRAVDRFYWGIGNGGITKYLYPGGQCQEATRDWGHVQLGIGEFSSAYQTAWTQGLDFYSVAQNRLAHGYEQTAKMMLGTDVDIFGKLSKRDMDVFRDIYESIYDYYTKEKGIDLPYTKEIIDKHTRAESGVGLLTALKNRQPHSQPLRKLPPVDFLKPTETGALDNPAKAIPADAIIINPGESIQEAIDQNKGKGKTIVLARGVHTLQAPLKIYSGMTLAGYGKESILFLSPEMRTETIVGGEDGLQNVTIRDILIEGAVSVIENNDPNHDRRTRSYMSAPSREGIIIRSETGEEIKNITMENVTIQNFTKNGVLIVGASNVKINRCNFSDNGSSVVPGAGFHHNLYVSHSTNCEITDSRFDTSPYGNGVYILSGKNITLSGNEMCRNRLSGIRCAESEQITIQNNHTEGNDKDGIRVDAWISACSKVTIRGNTAQNNGQYGILTDKVSELTLENNKLENNKK